MLSILVIDESRTRAAEICAGLALAGHQVAAVLSSALDLSEQVEAIRPDVILIETDSPSRDTLEHLATLNRDLPRPVIIFAQEGDAEAIRHAMKAGVAAYVVDGLETSRLKPIVEVAVARFEEEQALRRELAAASQKLSERKLVERAKGLLMQRQGLSEHQAYEKLRKTAMDKNLRLAEVAQRMLDMADLLG
jgi:response regulator NasT